MLERKGTARWHEAPSEPASGRPAKRGRTTVMPHTIAPLTTRAKFSLVSRIQRESSAGAGQGQA
jgi:hypothetical protein